MAARRALVAMSLILCPIGCTEFEGLKLAAKDGGGVKDGGAANDGGATKEAGGAKDGGAAKDAGPVAQCEHARVLPRALVATVEVDDPLEMAFVVKTVDFGEGPRTPRWSAEDVGFDLDETCTGEGAGPTCAPPSGVAQPDGKGGRDNVAGMLARPSDGGISAADIDNAATAIGEAAMLLYVSGYNKLPVDNDVAVAMYAVTGEGKTPSWDGAFEWVAAVDWTLPSHDGGGPDSALPYHDGGAQDSKPPKARYKASEAYVSNGFLVAKFPLLVNLPSVRFSNVNLQAKIEFDSDTRLWKLSDGVFAGRMNASDSLIYIEGRLDPSSQKDHICRDSPLYEPLKKATCGLSDILFSGENDPTQPCDAISWAWKFEAVAARLSSRVYQGQFKDHDWCNADVSPATDRCVQPSP